MALDPWAEFSELEAVSGIVMHRVDFSRESPSVLTLERSGLALVRLGSFNEDYYFPHMNDPLKTPKNVTLFVEDLGEPDRNSLIKGIGEAFCYPKEFLFHPNLNEVVALLEQLHHHMITATYGETNRAEFIDAIDHPKDLLRQNGY